MIIYNKLIRDNIHQIIEANGKKANVMVLEDTEYKKMLDAKLQEELDEYTAAENDKDQVEELADLVELVYAILESKGIGVEEFEKVRLAKREGHGGFERKYMLINVNEPYTFDTVKLFRRNKEIIFILTIEKFIYYCSHNHQINKFSLKALTAHNNTGDFQQFRRLKELYKLN
jgi:predicted house-cleaning noncanonical NTP pyrophosphatase (MazG superfamily)